MTRTDTPIPVLSRAAHANAQAFCQTGLLSHVDPARLPTPADVLPGFPGPCAPESGFFDAEDAWARLHLKGIDPEANPRKATVVHLVRVCLHAGLSFESDIKNAVADALSLAQTAPERQEYSAFGTELHFARLYLRRVEDMKSEATAWSESRLKPRRKLPAMRIDSRLVNAVRVLTVVPPRVIDRDGERLAVRPARITVTGKSARQIVTLTLSAADLRTAQQEQQAYTRTAESRRDAEGHRPARTKARPVPVPSAWTNLIPDAEPGNHL